MACDPNNVTADFNLGLLLEEKEEESAKAHYELAVEHGRGDPKLRQTVVQDSLDRLGDIAYRRNDLDGAIAYFRQVLEIEPNSSVAHHKLGLIQLTKEIAIRPLFISGAGPS